MTRCTLSSHHPADRTVRGVEINADDHNRGPEQAPTPNFSQAGMPVDHRATRAIRYHFGTGDAGETAIGIARGQSVEPAAYGGILLHTHHCPVVVPNDRELGKKQVLARIIARGRGR